MTQAEPSILTGWWHFAVRALSALTTPRADIDGCDRSIEQLARESAVGSFVHRSSAIVQSAWFTSGFRRGTLAVTRVLTPAPSSAAWRVAGWMIAVVGATALGVNELASGPRDPLTWIAPTVLVAAGLLVMLAAAPLARAAADRRLRHKVS